MAKQINHLTKYADDLGPVFNYFTFEHRAQRAYRKELGDGCLATHDEMFEHLYALIEQWFDAGHNIP